MITSYEDVMNARANGRTQRIDWNKNMLPTTAAVASESSFLARGAGNPGADALYNTGTNLVFQPVIGGVTANAGGLPLGSNVAPFQKQLVNSTVSTTSGTTAPCILTLVDLVGFYRVTSVTTVTSQALTNTFAQTNAITAVDTGADTVNHTAYNLLTGTRVQLTTSGTLPAGLALATDYFIIRETDTRCKLATSYANARAGTAIDITGAGSGTHTINWLLPRYTNGAGVQAIMWNTNATALGAATPNLSLPNYTNSEQVSGRATPATLPIGKTAAANGLILYSGTGSGKYPLYMPLQGADGGVAQVNNVQLSVSYVSGEFAIGLVKPLISMPITTLGVASERKFLTDAERIYDGANLHWLINHGAATPVNSALWGHLDMAWTP